MKTTALFSLALLCSVTAFAQQPTIAPLPPGPPMLPLQPLRALQPATAPAAPEKEPVNYLVTVKWSDAKAGTNFLQVLTTPGQFNLEAIQSSVRIDKNDVPTTVSFKGTLTAINADKVNVQVFLGRTVPYVTSTYAGAAGPSSSYQQMRVGLDSHFVVTLGKPVVIQSDQNGDVTLSVQRQEN